MIDVKKKTAVFMFKTFGLSEETTSVMFSVGILKEHICKQVLIKDEYFSQAEPKKKMQKKLELADEYCVSLSTIEKYLSSQD